MKRLGVISINFYQIFLSTIIKSIAGSPNVCRFSETCSDYAKRVIEEKGFLKGSMLGVVRLFKCQPFYKI
jgi:putative membrane protein insertion efficiency factor